MRSPLAFALILLIGCVPASVLNHTAPDVRLDVVPLAKAALPALAPGADVAVLAHLPTEGSYDDVALVSAVTDTGTYTHKDFGAILPHLQAKARALGADAIVVKHIDLGDSPMWNKYNSNTPTKVFCVLIRRRDPRLTS